MQIYRLFLNAPLAQGAILTLNESQAHYVRSVVRMVVGEAVLVFNGVDGEWHAEVRELTKKHVSIIIRHQTCPQTACGVVDVYFAPLKAARLEYVVQKMVEMGARSITPIKTQHTQSANLNMDKVQGYIHEAAEQCGILSLPKLNPIHALRDVLENWSPNETLIFCDETALVVNPVEALQSISPHSELAICIGPEGGFSQEERAMLRSKPYVLPIALGPRILRADTALVAAMAVIQAVKGDW